MRNTIIIIITLALIALVIVEQVFIDNTFNDLEIFASNLKTDIAEQSEISTENITEQIDNLYNFWNVKESLLCLTINHKDLDKIGEQIDKLKTYILEDNKEYAVYELNVLIFYINSYKNITAVSFKNILWQNIF